MEKPELKNQKRTLLWFAVFLVSTVFYLIWYWHDGVIIAVDAPSYITMEIDREPIYPAFLWLFRTIFGEDRYLDIVVIVQCVIAGLAAMAVTKDLTERFRLKLWASGTILFVQYGITLLNRFVAQRRYSYYNSICTEALAYSFWVFFLLSILKILYDHKKRDVVWSLMWCVLMISVRKHMIISLCILFLAIVYTKTKSVRTFWKACVLGLALMAAGFACTQLIDRTYNYMLRGEFAPHTGDSTFILGNEFYVATPEMADDLSTEEEKEIFMEILRREDEKEWRMAYAPADWMGMEYHYSVSYDCIKFETVMVVIREWLNEHGVPEEAFNARYEEIANQLTKELLPATIPGMLQIFKVNLLSGFVTTVLKTNRYLNIAAVLIYLAFIGLVIDLAHRDKKRDKNTSLAAVEPASAVPAALMILAAIVINVCFTSLTIFTQMRYMLYNTAFFYQIGLVMLIQAFAKRQHVTGKNDNPKT